MSLPLILASSSQGRKMLLAGMGIFPDFIVPSNIDESQKKHEKPIDLVKRLSREKTEFVANNYDDGIIIGADTIVLCKGRIQDKTIDDEMVRSHLKNSRGSRIKVLSAIYFIKKENKLIAMTRKRLVTSIIKLKMISDHEIEDYVESKEGIGKSGGMSILGKSSCFIVWMRGSASGIIGLPALETKNILTSLGYDFKSSRKN